MHKKKVGDLFGENEKFDFEKSITVQKFRLCKQKVLQGGVAE